MHRFKYFIKEGLVNWQRELADKAASGRSKSVLKSTDHYFGAGQDSKKLSIADPDSKKTDAHQAVEAHLGREISHNDYKEGMVAADPSKSKNRTKIGKLVKDPSIRDAFNADPYRLKLKGDIRKYAPVIHNTGEHYEMSIHRGAEVAGMSNSESAPEHPTGHSWAVPKTQSQTGTGSCMTHPTIDSLNSGEAEDKGTLSTLHSTVKHGGVVMYGRKNGLDKYRELRIPYKNNTGHNIFHKNNSYGEHHPAFLSAGEEESKKLSGPAHGSIVYKADRSKFYVEGPNSKLRPGTTDKDVEHALTPGHKDFEHHLPSRMEIAETHAKTQKHFDLIAKDDNWEVRRQSLINSNVPTSHREKLAKDSVPAVHKTAQYYLDNPDHA